jgi:hypothetical protein
VLCIATKIHRPSRVVAVPYPEALKGIHVFNLYVAVSITAKRGFVWSPVKTVR